MVNWGWGRESRRLWLQADAATPNAGKSVRMRGGMGSSNGVQLRAFGRVALHQHDTVSNRHWEQISIAAQWLYSTAPK